MITVKIFPKYHVVIPKEMCEKLKPVQKYKLYKLGTEKNVIIKY